MTNFQLALIDYNPHRKNIDPGLCVCVDYEFSEIFSIFIISAKSIWSKIAENSISQKTLKKLCSKFEVIRSFVDGVIRDRLQISLLILNKFK